MHGNLSQKIFICKICGKERIGNVDFSNNPLCWWCVQQLLRYSQEKIKNLYQECINKGFNLKAKILEKWVLDEEVENGEGRRNLDRKRVSRKVRSFNKER